MKHIYSFEKLHVWKLFPELVKKIYRVLPDFPAGGQFNLISQMKRSAHRENQCPRKISIYP
ncbi:MAG TPA: four helix bundle protein [Bacteroidetes bacterium]|nr:four helix bundle protein [Bacteroidota bacterium]